MKWLLVGALLVALCWAAAWWEQLRHERRENRHRREDQ